MAHYLLAPVPVRKVNHKTKNRIAITGPIISLSLGSVALVTPTTDSKFPPDSVKTTITLTSSSNSAVVFTTFTSTSTPATKSPTATLVVTPTMFVTITSTDASSVTAPSNGAASNSHLVSGHTTAGMMGLLGVILAVF
ncbi:hypothetical protein C0995_008161 [Termitomyces sp. Mi166|nr:hypothetical protein C0995_008161 [Termitomyces sp. Mi166\